jgi:hypothetical protein
MSHDANHTTITQEASARERGAARYGRLRPVHASRHWGPGRGVPPAPNSPATCHLIDSFTSADADTRAQGDRQETQAVVPEGATACDALPAPRQSVKARGTEGVRGGGAQPPAYEARSQRIGGLLLAQAGAGACASCARRQTACHAECQAHLTACEARMIPGGINCEGIYNACVSDCDTAAETYLASCGR